MLKVYSRPADDNQQSMNLNHESNIVRFQDICMYASSIIVHNASCFISVDKIHNLAYQDNIDVFETGKVSWQ